jgi:O-acetyl-ADP-ribose deacetylase (regulator of RNase III)
MSKIKEVNGNLLTLASEGNFDLIMHGCNCFNTFGAGIALQIKNLYPSAYLVDCETTKGDINKLGNFTKSIQFTNEGEEFTIINAYSQFDFHKENRPFDYEAFSLICQKINHLYPKMSIGIPQIGAGLGGGNWENIKEIITEELSSMKVTIVYFK